MYYGADCTSKQEGLNYRADERDATELTERQRKRPLIHFVPYRVTDTNSGGCILG